MKAIMTQAMKKRFRDLGFKCEETEKEIIFKSDGYLVEYIVFDKDIRVGCEVDYEWYFLDINTKEKSNIGIASANLINLVNDTVEKLYSRCQKLGLFNVQGAKLLKEPTLHKDEVRVLDYKELSFKDFIIIREKAQEVVNNIGYPIYLVGSSIYKNNPRDIDLSVIIPHDEYVKKYHLKVEDWEYGSPLHIAEANSAEDIKPLTDLCEQYKIDLKICADNWWEDKDKILLAMPLVNSNA